MNKKTALKIMRLALDEKGIELSIDYIQLYDTDKSIIIYFNDILNDINYCIDYSINDIIEFSSSPVREDWIDNPVEICNITKVLDLLKEWKWCKEYDKIRNS